MFDIGFTELLLVGIVALLVVGPEKLPSVIRTGLQYFRQFKSGIANIRDDVERELALDEVKQNLIDSKEELNNSIGYNRIKDNLSELKGDVDEIRNFTDWDDVDSEEIENDLLEIEGNFGPTLPSSDEHRNTGVEEIGEPKESTQKMIKESHNNKIEPE